MRDRILAHILRLGGSGVSFVEMERVDGFSGGDLGYGSQELNIIFWDFLTQEAIDALRGLQDDGLVQLNSTPLLVYLCDGKMLRYPIAQRAGWKYKDLRWLPVCLKLTDAGWEEARRRGATHAQPAP
jgi:hypothetical protein